MNYRIAKTMLILCVVYLIGLYILKFIFPELLLQTITSPTILRLGEMMSRYKILEHALKLLSSFLTYYLFVCASSGRFKRTWLEMFYIVLGVAICKVVVEFLPDLYTHTSISVMFILALLCKGNLKKTAIAFVLHGYCSQFLFLIRGFETVVIYVNSISGFLINIEGLFWLALLGIIFYIKENKENG